MRRIMLMAFFVFVASASAQAIEYTWENEQGKEVNISSLAGKPVLLHFWASWCPPCRKEMPALVKWIGEHPEVNVVVLSLDRARQGAQEFFAEHNIKIPLNMGNMAGASRLGVRGLPSTFVVDAKGDIVKRYTGDIHWSDPEKSKEVLGWL